VFTGRPVEIRRVQSIPFPRVLTVYWNTTRLSHASSEQKPRRSDSSQRGPVPLSSCRERDIVFTRHRLRFPPDYWYLTGRRARDLNAGRPEADTRLTSKFVFPVDVPVADRFEMSVRAAFSFFSSSSDRLRSYNHVNECFSNR